MIYIYIYPLNPTPSNDQKINNAKEKKKERIVCLLFNVMDLKCGNMLCKNEECVFVSFFTFMC